MEDYFIRMAKDEQWGGNMELQVATEVYRSEIKVCAGVIERGELPWLTCVLCHRSSGFAHIAHLAHLALQGMEPCRTWDPDETEDVIAICHGPATPREKP